jgi:hypothetical protein
MAAPIKSSEVLKVFSPSEVLNIIDMKNKAIGVRATKFDFFKTSIPEGLILAGGCFSSFFHRQEAKDYDVFVLKDKNFNTTRHAIDKFILDHEFSTASPRFRIGNSAYINNQNNENKIIKTIFDTQTKVQFIITEFTTREELIGHFDCEHACVSFDIHDEKLYISRSTYDCIENKLIRRHKDNTILDWRKQKFKALGWTVL